MPNSQLKNCKILFVEDETKIREHIVKTLKYLVEDVEEASNGKEALEKMQKFSPNIIITDLEMPLMGGIEFVTEVRKTNKTIPIVVLTAHTNSEYLLKLIDMHIEHFIVKPMNFEKLLDALQKCEKAIQKSSTIQQTLPLKYSYNWEKKILSYEEQEIRLTKKQIAFLELLFKNPRRIVTYSEIEEYVWGDESIMTENSIRSLVKNLRKKLPDNLIENLSGIGYKLV
jgi:DNA-binding response OmpR family regulator